MTPISLGIFASAANVAAAGDFQSIATVTVGAGGSSTIEFTSIPSTYTHLQIRGITRTTNAANQYRNGRLTFNSDSNTVYATHLIAGDASSSFADWSFGDALTYPYKSVDDSTTANTYSGIVIDILDYANTNKFKTIRGLSGVDYNGNGVANFASGLWRSTNAITSIQFYNSGTGINWKQYSTLALYGIKVAV